MANGLETTKPKAAAKPAKDRPTVVSVASWLMLQVTGLIAIAGAAVLTLETVEAQLQAEANPAAIPAELTLSNSPDYLEILSEQALGLPRPDEAIAFLAARRATEIDPTRAFAWARLAYLEARRDGGKVNAEALAALTRSMEACPLCDTQLIRWRFNFVLTHWDDMPEDIRRAAFVHADLLRWIGAHEEYLAEMRVKANLKGIPFDAYRKAVDTPARSWDIASAPRLRGTQAVE